MADMDVRRCPACGAIFIEDSRMWTEPTRCPHCGYDLIGHVNETQEDGQQ